MERHHRLCLWVLREEGAEVVSIWTDAIDGNAEALISQRKCSERNIAQRPTVLDRIASACICESKDVAVLHSWDDDRIHPPNKGRGDHAVSSEH